MKKIGLIVLFCGFNFFLNAQIDTLVTSTDSPVLISDSSAIDKVFRSETNGIYSAIIPGWGQVRNKQPLKGVVFLAAVAGGTLLTIDQTKEFSRYDDAYISRVGQLRDGLAPIDEFATSLDFDQLLDERRSNRSTKDIYTGITAYTYLVNVADAMATAKIREEEIQHSPAKAAYYSFILPGMGQAYNKKYWKIPLVYGALGASTYVTIDNRNKHRLYREEIERRTANLPAKFRPNLDEGRLQENLEYWRKWRDFGYVATGAVYFLNIVDATVDAHLYEYDVDDDLGFRPSPVIGQSAEGLPYYAVKITFGIDK